MSEASILITGAAKRIGAGIATGLAQEGHSVIIHYSRSADDAEALVKVLTENGHTARAVQADLSTDDGIHGLIEDCGPLCALINNASSFAYDAAHDITLESLEANYRVNAAAPMLLARDFAAQANGDDPCVINILDHKLVSLDPDYFSYTVAKAALGAATQMMALAFAPDVRVNAIGPGITLPSGPQSEARFEKVRSRNPLKRNASVADLLRAVRFLLDTPSITGQMITIDGGASLQRAGRDVEFQD